MDTTLQERLDRRSIPEAITGCTLWWGAATARGYGHMTYRKRHLLAHRAAWTASRGAVPDGMEVCHRCDTPACINLDHLFLATHAENMADMYAKDRFARVLSRERIQQVRSARGSNADVALRFGTSPSHVSRIRRGESWASLPMGVAAA